MTEEEKLAEEYADNVNLAFVAEHTRQAFEQAFLAGYKAGQENIKALLSEKKEIDKKLADKYRKIFNEDKEDKLALNQFYHNIIDYNCAENILADIEDRNARILCFGTPPILTEETVEIIKPKWHKVADGDLPKDITDVLTYSISQGYQMKRFYPTVKIFGDLAVREVIAWCEIPKYEEE